jgi:peptidoglycan/xylan/chitin deacetylase (PgdA/CDA1 family)
MFYEQGKMKAVTFSFDDGTTQDIRLIDLLNKYNLKSTFNLNSGLLAQKGLLFRDGQRIAHYKLYPEHVKPIYEGHEVAVHTVNHKNLTQCTDQEIIYQVETDRLKLSELVGYEVVGMAYPCGGVNNNDHVAEVIKNNTGVRYSRTITTNNCFDLQENLFRFDPTAFYLDFENMMALGQKFIELKADKPQVFYIWGHAFEMDYGPDYWLRLEEFFKLISGHDDIFYGTNKEVLL